MSKAEESLPSLLVLPPIVWNIDRRKLSFDSDVSTTLKGDEEGVYL